MGILPTLTAESALTIREVVKQRHAATLRAKIAAAHWIDNSEHLSRQKP
jgi:hypothetical protein